MNQIALHRLARKWDIEPAIMGRLYLSPAFEAREPIQRAWAILAAAQDMQVRGGVPVEIIHYPHGWVYVAVVLAWIVICCIAIAKFW